jgi:hypothetical protein
VIRFLTRTMSEGGPVAAALAGLAYMLLIACATFALVTAGILIAKR